MSRPAPSRPSRRPRGIAAVEMALILPVFVLLLALPLFLGRALYHYQIMHRAAHDAARYLASCATIDYKSPARVADVQAAARTLVAAELAGASAGSYPPAVGVNCDGGLCGGFAVPTTVSVQIITLLEDDVFPDISYNLVGSNGLQLNVTVTMHYVGN
ncbi:TadE/TadG family type IV pilus assembly protein [Duganella violaceipulchra]|uniref:Pilus assembly protein n=1 Tax=Duganella violaceipulchra TaxID=2849652 RepID=A0AA41HBM2_9BURK|nr:TadE family protein [Duganella violaceicalia]MBV6324405.1 pilus assembly protein [Duganella violaceicalia]MCP2012008.1 Flp pilus assembly protein TadG [Duganella violaceicalia]